MDASPELRAMLGWRLRVVEGTAHGNCGGSHQGATLSAPAVARFPPRRFAEHRLAAEQRLAAYGGNGANSQNQVTPPVPRRHPANDSQVRQACRSERVRSEQRVEHLTQRNEQLTREVERMKEKFSKVNGGVPPWSDQVEMLLAETDELLAETDRASARNKRAMQQRSEARELKRNSGAMEVQAISRTSTGSLAADLDAVRRDNSQLQAQVAELKGKCEEAEAENQKLRQTSQELEEERQRCRTLDEENKRLAAELEKESSALQGALAETGPGPENRLRTVLTTQGSTPENLKQAIGAVEALLDEARRELAAKQLRERRAAFEELHKALELAEEERLASAIERARKAEVDEEDICKAQAKLSELRALTDEQRAARDQRVRDAARKKDLYLCVKKDDVEKLHALLTDLTMDGVRWQDWKDYAGRSVWRCAQELRARSVQKLLAPLLGMDAPDSPKPKPWPTATTPKNSTPANGFGMSSPAVPPNSMAVPVNRKDSSVSVREGSSLAETALTAAEIPNGSSGEGPQSQVSGTIAASTETECSPKKHNEFPMATGYVSKDAALSTQSSSPTSTTGAEVDAGGMAEVSCSEEAQNPEVVTLRPEEEQRLKSAALRLVVRDDAAGLVELLRPIPSAIWSKWENKAGKDLLTLSQERGSTTSYSVLAKALGILTEQKRDAFEDREAVWVFLPGEVQPQRATVCEDTPADKDTVLIEYWEGDDPPMEIDRAMVRKMWS
eukprot:CAMPEP_0117594656 /NCGR_PEP_ID=MMETSP0784-20121206/73325_1 /TAXON_ID=39447 /ORGANISM="" /LENGTH=730 /DNA_ID=CAMNT_0005396745 /DNA_START=99 /DNA_END=2291 /DNA_ORIENTATION=-